MGGTRRRGSVSLMHEQIISLVLVALFAVAVFAFIARNTDGSLYWSRFYTADLATSAETVAAGNGDVILRYDNIKPDLELTFTLDDGIVRAGTAEKTLSTDFYGKTDAYKGEYSLRPLFVMVRKIDGKMAITDAETLLKACPGGKIAGPVSLTGPEPAKAAFKRVLKGTRIEYTEDPAKAAVRLTLLRGPPGKNTITFSPTSEQGRDLSCHVYQQASALTAITFGRGDPVVGSGEFALTVTLRTTPEDTFTDEQAGKALALAIAGYAR